MSRENVELVRRGFDAFNRRDRSAWLALAHPDLEWLPPAGLAGERDGPRGRGHRMNQKRPEGLVFGRAPDRPFNPSAVRARAAKAWERGKLNPIGLHECRHSYAALMIASGGNAKALSTYMGHSTIQVTYDKYGALMPGNEEEAAGLLDAYLERANTKARLAAVESR